jgi:hypothetical protein
MVQQEHIASGQFRPFGLDPLGLPARQTVKRSLDALAMQWKLDDRAGAEQGSDRPGDRFAADVRLFGELCDVGWRSLQFAHNTLSQVRISLFLESRERVARNPTN